MEFLTRTKIVKGTDSVQPLPSEVPSVIHRLRQNAKITNLEHSTTERIMLSPLVGFSVENPINFKGTPPRDMSILGVPSIRWTDSPVKRGNC